MVSTSLKLAGLKSALDTFEDLNDRFGPHTVIVGTNANYAAYVEFGTSKMSAQPYLIPAITTVLNKSFPRILDKAWDTDNPPRFALNEIAREIEELATRWAPRDTGFLARSISWVEFGRGASL